MNVRIRRAASMVFVASVSWASLASAQTASRSDASTHFERGIELFNEGRFDASLAEFQRAYDVDPAYPVLYNLGRVHAELGHPVESARAYARYLEQGGDALPAARRREVEQALVRQRQRIGWLLVETNVPGSTISIDGFDVATTPLAEPIELGAGQHTLGVRAPGHESATRAVQIAGGVRDRMTVELRREIEARGTLRITASVPGVLVRVDGHEVGRTPLDATVPVLAGDHDVAGERAGYLSDARRVHVEEQAEVEVSLRLSRDPAATGHDMGALQLNLPNVAYAVRIDGEERSVVGDVRLPIGTHQIEVDAVERQSWSGPVHIEPDVTTTFAPPLSWTPAARMSRLGAADTQRGAGIGLSIGGAGITLASLALVIWNQLSIADTDRQSIDIDRENVRLGCPTRPGADECRPIVHEINRLMALQNEQNLIQGVSITTLVVGGLLTVLGVVLYTTTPSSEEIDNSAHPRLTLGPRGASLEF